MFDASDEVVFLWGRCRRLFRTNCSSFSTLSSGTLISALLNFSPSPHKFLCKGNRAFLVEKMECSDFQSETTHEDWQDDLTDDQMKQLLGRAELRLKGQTTNFPQPEVFPESLTKHIPYKCDSCTCSPTSKIDILLDSPSSSPGQYQSLMLPRTAVLPVQTQLDS